MDDRTKKILSIVGGLIIVVAAIFMYVMTVFLGVDETDDWKDFFTIYKEEATLTYELISPEKGYEVKGNERGKKVIIPST